MKLLKNTLSVALIAIAITCLNSCDKEDDFEVVVAQSEEATFVVNSLSAVIENAMDIMSFNFEISNQNHTLLPSTGRVKFYDYTFLDGDGVRCIVSYGENPKGSMGHDGRFRSGTFSVSMSRDYEVKYNLIEISIEEKDRLRVFKNGEQFHILGKIILKRQGFNTWFYETKNISLISSERKIYTDLAGFVRSDIEGLPGLSDNKYSIGFSGAISSGLNYSIFTPENKMLQKDFSKDCWSNYQSGTMVLELEGKENATIELDPFNDEACDVLAKVRWHNKEELIQVQ